VRNAVRVTLILSAALLAMAGTARRAGAQKADTLRPPPAAAAKPAADTTQGPRRELMPPLSPARSFAYSFIVPGYAQTVLGRPRASALFIALEAMCVTMLRQAQFDLRQARNAGTDSIVVSRWDPATGQSGVVMQASPYNSQLIRSRRAHVEDWIAVLVANHLFSGLDAYVSANLWDLPAELSVHPTSTGTNVGLTLHVR